MFTEVLDGLLRERGISRTELSRGSGIPYTTIDGWFKKGGDNVRLPTLKRLAEYLGVSLDTLADMPGSGPSPSELNTLRRMRGLDAHGRRMVELTLSEELARIREAEEAARAEEKEPLRWIPWYSTMAAAGFAAPSEGVDYTPIPVTGDVPENAGFAVTIDGDSMEPYIKNGERVYCVKDGRGVSVGDVGIFCVDGAHYCKQYCTDGSNVYLLSLNRARADADIVLWATGNRSLTLLGRVIMSKRVPMP